MNVRIGLLTLFAPIATVALLIPATVGGCQDDGGGGGGATTTTGTTTTGTGGGTGLTGGGGTGNTGGTGGSGADPTCGYNAVDTTIQDITDPTSANHVGPGVEVRVTGVVAMSRKFKVSGPGNSGSCLWGVFLSAPGLSTTEEYSGILAVSYGDQATTNDAGETYCPVAEMEPAGDAFPDDTAPGDVLTVIGNTDSYIPSTCSAGQSQVPQLQISQVCSAERTSTGATLPTPADLTANLADLGSPTDQDFHNRWGGVKVRITNVSADGSGDQGDCGGGQETVVADNYGNIVLNEGGGLQVGDKIYYQGLLKFLGATCRQGPQFCVSPGGTFDFVRIDGFSYQNYCTWQIEPNQKCEDIDPDSADCPCTETWQ